MALVQAKGLLQEGQVLGNAALPSFERWSMTAPRYLQYLANLLHVHTALERATATALTEGLASHSGASLLLFISLTYKSWYVSVSGSLARCSTC